MDGVEAAKRSAEPVVGLAAGFMMDGATYEHGAKLGFEGVDFYMAGRGGALGEVSGAVVAATFFFFNPATVCEAWERSSNVMSRAEAVREFSGCASRWAASHLPDSVDCRRLAELAGKVAAHASPAGLPLFAGWAALGEPEGPKALALHRMNVLRELRGSIHAAAVLVSGLDPRVAVMVRNPQMAALFGWEEPHPDPEPERERWAQAEAATDIAMGRRLEVLTAEERSEFVELASAAYSNR